jgi:hypothetical protein
VSSKQIAARTPLARVVKTSWLALCVVFTAACHLEMYDQPSVKPYQESAAFADGVGSRAPQPNTVSPVYR